jgi:metallo-beta-lactamase family protein
VNGAIPLAARLFAMVRRSGCRDGHLPHSAATTHMAKLQFLGAAGEVTGSCYLVTTDRARVMVDMGMHQGERDADAHNRRLPPIEPGQIDAVVLTHAHLDHCGRLPMLVKGGFRGRIHCTRPTADITEVILRDSAHLQAEDYGRFLRRTRGKPVEREPLYHEPDVDRTISKLSTMEYEQPTTIAEGVAIKFVDAGHILGAASVPMTVDDGTGNVRIVFSGDIGQIGAPIVRDPITPSPADVVLLESTYGNRDHRSRDETLDEFLTILQQAQSAGSKVIIPAFALGRAQDLLYHLGEFLRTDRLPRLDVYIDSPMATAISRIYAGHVHVYDDHAQQLIDQQLKPLNFPRLSYTQSVDESKRLNDTKGPMVIISANGMCTGGRILHHLRHNLPERSAHVVIVGYQGQGTLGRRLVDGARFVRIFGQDVPVRATIHTLGGFSAHAGQSGLLNWISALMPNHPRVFLTHGEDGPRAALRQKLKSRFGLDATLPYYGDVCEL